MSLDSVQKDTVVSMEYTLQVENEEIDSSKGQDPLQFLVGHGNIISGLEREMIGMKVGESKNVVIAPADGYGEFDEEAYMNVPRSEFPKDMDVEEGLELTVRDDQGQARYARVDTIDGDVVTLNFNHPLAGDELHFNVKVVDLREPTAEELDKMRALVDQGMREGAVGMSTGLIYVPGTYAKTAEVATSPPRSPSACARTGSGSARSRAAMA